MRTSSSILLAMLLLPCHVLGDDWLGTQMDRWPKAAWSKVENDFGAMLVVTSDNWQEKWNHTPRETIPQWNAVRRLKVGEKASVLTFFANPMLDASNRVRVLCDLKATRPDNSVAFDLKKQICMEGELGLGVASDIRLSPVVVEFSGEKSDPLGIWVVEVKVHDMNRDTRLDLRTTFELVGSE